MNAYAGMCCYNNLPVPVQHAEVSDNRIVLKYDGWTIDVYSDDGWLYEGRWTKPGAAESYDAKLWRYQGKDQGVCLFLEWENPHKLTDTGEAVVRLFPIGSGLSQMPAELERVRDALRQAQVAAASEWPELTLTLVSDRKFGRHERLDYLQQRGVYVLFYNNGKVARVGQAGAPPLGKRLLDYDSDQHRWFVFRWIAVAPCGELPQGQLDALESRMLSILQPPECKHLC
jgi:hypothetical protein